MTPDCIKSADDQPCKGYQIVRAHLDIEREVQKKLIAERDKWFNEAIRLRDGPLKALEAACGYLLNAKIDLETGAPRATAIRTIEGGLKMAQEAIAKTALCVSDREIAR